MPAVAHIVAASQKAGASSSEASLNSISDRYGPLVQGALTPRFVPTCSRELLRQLGRIAEQHPEVVVQSHISESVDQAFASLLVGCSSPRIFLRHRAAIVSSGYLHHHIASEKEVGGGGIIGC